MSRPRRAVRRAGEVPSLSRSHSTSAPNACSYSSSEVSSSSSARSPALIVAVSVAVWSSATSTHRGQIIDSPARNPPGTTAAGRPHTEHGLATGIPTRRRVLAEQSDEWTEGRRYMSLELLAKSRIRVIATEPEPVADEPSGTTEALTA